MDLDYKAILTEEIALEGLDGITLQALWVRLDNRPNFKMRLDEGSQEFLWRCVLSIPDLEFYCLPSPRGVLNPKLPIVIDPESGVTVDFDMGEEMYPIKIIQQEGPIIGSCSTYDSRQCVTMEIRADGSGTWPTAKDVTEKYGMSLVVVASQEQRFTALCGDELEPNSLYSLTAVNFCILERIGRSRRVGELSIGDSSLQVFNIQPKSMFYHTLCLIKLGLVKKQSITVYNKKGQNSLRRLFHLTRFYQQYQSKYTILTNMVATYLNKQPMKRQEIHKTREQCGIDQKSLKKLYQTSKRFKVYSLPYKQIHPESPENQWYTKKCELKMVRVIEVVEEEESDVEDDEDTKMDDTAKDDTVFPQLVEPSFLRQAYAVLEAAGTDGISNSKMMKRLTIDGLEVRMIIRTMERRGLITSLMTEVGKQKKKVSVSKTYVEGNKLMNQINKEKEKLKQSLQDINDKQRTAAEASKSSNDVKTESDETESRAKSAGKKKGGSPKKRENVKAIEEEVSGIVNNVGRHKRHFKTDVSATCQQMKRINMILDIIKENKIVDGVYPIVKLIREKEREEKNAYMVDKKTVMRLVAILVKEKKINIINTVLLDGSKQKNLQMLLSKEVEPTDQLVKSLIDQAHMKFQAVNKEQLAKKNARTRGIPENSNIPETAREGILQIMSHRSKLKAEDMIYDVAYSKQYDFRPKYSRAKILHSLLWYLVYDFPEFSWPLTGLEGGADTPPCPPASSSDIKIEEDVFVLIDKIPKPPVYKDEMTWKRFLSPLPRHKGYDEGWFLASDILLKLPLVIFCNVIYIPYRIRGLRELLDDPEKRFYPIVSLPTPITQQLLYARKYIFSFFNDCVVLCNMGLLSIGPQIMKEKDKVFFYLHKKASLLDTKNSEPGYCMINMESPPDILEYNFISQSLVDQYWVDLRHISINSHLGCKNKRDEEAAVTVNSAVVPLPDARSSVTVEEVKDDGFVPGDKRGAAGLDSSLFLHLYRNWSGLYSLNKHNKLREKKVQVKIEATRFAKKNNFATLQKVRSGLAGVLPRPKERVPLHSKEKSPEIIRVSLTTNVKGNKGGKGVKRKPASTDANSSVPAKKAKTILKKVKQKKVKPKLRKFIYDEIDIEAYKKKKGQRVSWSPYEDSLLLTSKIATLVMDKKRRGVLIPWSYIRDVLYHYAPQESVDKTSSACQRRVTHSLKNPSTKQNLLIYLSEAMQDPYVKEFSQKQYLQASEHACKEFRTLVDYLVTKFTNVELQKTFMPASLAQVKDYDITCMTQFNLRKIPPPQEPRSRADILEYISKDIIHSFVSSAYDKQGRSHQMFKLLSQYPDSILDKAIDKLKYDGVIVQNKKREKMRPVDSGTNNLKLSQKYHYRFHSRYPTSIYDNTLMSVKEIENTYPYEDESSPESIEIKEIKNGGICSALVQLLYGRQVSIYVGIPPDIVILDPQYRQGFNQHMSLGKRSRLQEVLDSDDEDYPFELDQKDNRPKVLEQNRAWESTKTFDGPSPYVYDEDGTTIIQFNTSDRSNIQFHFDSSMDENKKGKEKSKLSTVCASRALVTMRRSRAEQDADLKHYNVQDHFLIQACDVKIRLCKDDDRNEVDPDLVLRDIPYDRSKARKIIKNAQRFVPFQLDLEDVWSSVDPVLLDNMKSVYRLIHDAGEMGICYFNLKELVDDWESFRVSIGHLLDKAAILRVGVTGVRYVSLPNARSWVIHNFRDIRGRGRLQQTVLDLTDDKLLVNNEDTGEPSVDGSEMKQETGTETASQLAHVKHESMVPVNIADTEARENENREENTSAMTQTENPESSEHSNGEAETVDGGDNRDSSQRMEDESEQQSTARPVTRSRSPRKQTQGDTEPTVTAGPKALSTYDRIRLQIFPWKKPEGYLNRPVYSQMLQSMLLYVISNPGISFKNISGRFLPYLLPFHVIELLKVLEEIGCVTKIILSLEPALSLFSPYQAPRTVEESDQTPDDLAYYEATVGAITILAKFVEQLNNTDSVQLHRVRKTTQSDANTASSQNDAETGASNQQDGQRVEQDGGEIPVSESASTHNGVGLEYIPEVEQNVDAAERVSPDVLLYEGKKIKGEVVEKTVEERGGGVSSEDAMDVGKQEEYLEEDIEMGDAT